MRICHASNLILRICIIVSNVEPTKDNVIGNVKPTKGNEIGNVELKNRITLDNVEFPCHKRVDRGPVFCMSQKSYLMFKALYILYVYILTKN